MGIKNILKEGRDKAARIYIKMFRRDLSSKGEKVTSNSFFADCVENYERELADWENPYGYFLRADAWESRVGSAVKAYDKEGAGCEGADKDLKEFFHDESRVTFGGFEYVLIISEKAEPAIGWKVAVREGLETIGGYAPYVIYGDEDVLENEARRNPFFKPDFSPELLEQFNYFGEMVLVRKDKLMKACPDYSESDAPSSEQIAEIVRIVVLEKESEIEFNEGLSHAHFYKNVLHIPHILSHRIVGSAAEDCEEAIKKAASQYAMAVASKARDKAEDQAFDKTDDKVTDKGCNERDASSACKVSVIIPTKDHPDVLKTCVSSLREKTEYPMDMIEIIVVDNGSEEAKKAEYEAMAAQYDYEYVYDPKPFNFSYMNNVGAKKATGELLLLLNDDTEVIDPSWLSKMVTYARRPEVGAVGAKLLYANTNKIQHAGVTNLAVGPSHKILALDDSENYYFGRNKLNYNMLSVTGACLLVSKEKYDEVGGLSEDLKVAYNDIDFCFKLFEHGYRSVQCNGAVLYHYESLTRGMDEGNEEKYKRLLAEKDKLYGMHPWAKGFDPFYNPNLIDNSSDYLPATKDCTKNTDSFSKLLDKEGPVPAESFMVRARLDRIQLQLRNTEDDVDFIWLDGWGFVRG
ncbi:MAG: glycosyltransferase family 2 protein, partial [Lachnospiraceae bacterium]|nr:glycosyltransferase family 2 protein [Lachnospiraceae bacterium]